MLMRREENSSDMRIKQWRSYHPPRMHCFHVSDGQYTMQELNSCSSDMSEVSGTDV